MSNKLIIAIRKTRTLYCSYHNSILNSDIYLEKFKKYNDNELDKIMLYSLNYAKKNINNNNIKNNEICLTSYRIDMGLKLFLNDLIYTKNEYDIKKRNNEAYEFGKKLENQGHKCVVYKESYPVQIHWCGKEQCDKI